MKAARNIIVGIIFPAAMLIGFTVWRGHTAAELAVYGLGWWFWYGGVIGMAVLIGVGLHCYWGHRQRQAASSSPSAEPPASPPSEG